MDHADTAATLDSFVAAAARGDRAAFATLVGSTAGLVSSIALAIATLALLQLVWLPRIVRRRLEAERHEDPPATQPNAAALAATPSSAGPSDSSAAAPASSPVCGELPGTDLVRLADPGRPTKTGPAMNNSSGKRVLY